jgi:transcriptional regulator with XRE-family HTH domain
MMETIGYKIRKLIKDKEMTQEELARKADIPYSTLIKIISGNVDNPTVRTIQKLAVALDVSVDELLTTIKTKS